MLVYFKSDLNLSYFWNLYINRNCRFLIYSSISVYQLGNFHSQKKRLFSIKSMATAIFRQLSRLLWSALPERKISRFPRNQNLTARKFYGFDLKRLKIYLITNRPHTTSKIPGKKKSVSQSFYALNFRFWFAKLMII